MLRGHGRRAWCLVLASAACGMMAGRRAGEARGGGEARGSEAARVLALAFTTRAAGELRGRLRVLGRQALPGGGMERVQARTFHAAALRQLTHFWPLTVGGPPPRVLDSKISLMSDAARQLRLQLSLPDLRDAAGEIEWAKVTGVRPEEYPQASSKASRTQPLGPIPLSRR